MSGNIRKKSRKVVVLKAAKKEGHKILSDFQYAWCIDQVKRLVEHGIPDGLSGLETAPFGEYFELKMKGSVLKRINLRIYYAFIPDRNIILVLKTYKKEEERQTSRHVMLNLEDRCEQYLLGNLEEGISVFEFEGDSSAS